MISIEKWGNYDLFYKKLFSGKKFAEYCPF